MTTSDYCIKWGAYGLALLPVWLFERCVLGYLPLPGGAPLLLPLAAIAAAVLEGGVAGAGFGLVVGILCDQVYFGAAGGWTIGLTLLGAGAGIASRYGLRQNLTGCLLCSAAGLILIDGVRALRLLLGGRAGMHAVLAVALPEILWSMAFVFPVYGLFRWVFLRVPKRTVL